MQSIIPTHTVPWRRLAIASLAVVTMMAVGVPRADAVPGVTVTPTSGLTTTEATGTATFTVVLTEVPTGDVTIPISSSDTTEGTALPASLTFTTGNWATPQTVTVTGVDDSVDDGDIAYTIVTGTATGGGYNLDPADVSVTNTDDDTKGITVTAISGNTAETGTTAQFTVVLTSEPTAAVTIPVSSSDPGEGTVSTSSLTFTTGNWATVQTVTVTGVDDAIVDGDVTFTIDLGAASGGDYAGLDAPNVSVTNTDDDVAGFTITETGGSTTTDESGTTDTFDVVLNKGPLSDVVLTVTSSDTGEGVVDKATLTFTSANWSTAQTVTVTGVDDSTDDGGQPYTVTVAVDAASSANAFDALAAQTVSAVNGDNDATPVDPVFDDLGGLSDEAVAAIEKLVDLGVTNGTDETSFSPAAITERWQMALFLTRVLAATGTTLPAAESGFSDLAGYSTEAQTAMNQLKSLGISMGTSADEFSPADQVTRWQMGLFLVRTLEAAGVTLPTPDESPFTDLAGYPVEVRAAVDVLVTLGITTGTTDTTFSPEAELPRWQMALFLARVIDVIQAG